MTYRTISVDDARALLAGNGATVVDIRDPVSFEDGHIDNAIAAETTDMNAFVAAQDKNKPLLVYCYHGISSRRAAQYFADNGFTQVYSLDGGYEAWANAESEE